MTQNYQADGAQSALTKTDPSSSAVAKVVAAIWRTLADPLLLLGLTVAAFLLVLAGLLTPQMPHPVYADPAAAARWLLNAGIDFGSLGELWSALGLFNLLHSTLLRILLVLITLMLAILLADQIGTALILRGLPARLSARTRHPATPIVLPKGSSIYRTRSAFPMSIEALSSETDEHLATRFERTKRVSVNIGENGDQVDSDAPTGDISAETARADADHAGEEERFLCMRAVPFAYLRPLLVLGLLVGLLALWLNVTFGWEVISPSLAPTESFQYPHAILISATRPQSQTVLVSPSRCSR